jgi:peptidoglycan hydrolase CwlO-like protein
MRRSPVAEEIRYKPSKERTFLEKSIVTTAVLSLSTAGLMWLASTTTENTTRIAVYNRVFENIQQDRQKIDHRLDNLETSKHTLENDLHSLKATIDVLDYKLDLLLSDQRRRHENGK